MRTSPILASESTAAQLLDMKPTEFRCLVEAGHLPKGQLLAPGIVRWSVEELRGIANGKAARPDGGLEL